jgi:hypothetical protein
MDVREKLVEIIQSSVGGCARHWAEVIADGLIANGVTVQEWISTDERMPTKDDATDGYVAAVYSWGDGVKTKTISLVDVVIAYPDLYDYWMPLNLPQPPKGE